VPSGAVGAFVEALRVDGKRAGEQLRGWWSFQLTCISMKHPGEPDAIEFQIGSFYHYHYFYYYGLSNLITEQLSTTQRFEFGGQLHAQRSGSAITGPLNGTLEIVTLPNNRTSAQCAASNNQVTARVAQPARHR
jgi:hypothetical protein